MLFFSKENGFCIFYQFWEIWTTNEKKFSEKLFVLFFAQKHRVWKKLTSFLNQSVAYKMFVQFTKPWTLYLVSVQRYRGLKVKNNQKERFIKNSFEKKPMKPNFFKNFSGENVAQELAQLLTKHGVRICSGFWEICLTSLKTWHTAHLFSVLRYTCSSMK